MWVVDGSFDVSSCSVRHKNIDGWVLRDMDSIFTVGRGIKGCCDDMARHSVNFWRWRLEIQSFSCSLSYEH